MATELGALDVVFRALGADQVFGAFRAIDAAGAKAAATAKAAAGAPVSSLRLLSQRYKELSRAVTEMSAVQGGVSPQLQNLIGQQVEYARSVGASSSVVGKWTALHARSLGITQQTTQATAQAAGAMGALGTAGTAAAAALGGVGAAGATAAKGATAAAGAMGGAARASTTAATGIGSAARAIRSAAITASTGIDAISRRIALLSTQLGMAGTRSVAIIRLTAAEAQLTRTLQFGNTTFAQRIRLERELSRTRAALAGRQVAATGSGLGIVGGLGALLSITALVRGYSAITDATDELRNSQERLRATAKITGTALEGLVATAGVGQKEFNLSASQANNLSIEMAKLAAKAGDISQATPALRAFLDLGAARGLDAEKTLLAVRQAILGIDEGTDKLFNANPSVLYKRYADAIGVSVGKLTDQQKAQAILNAAIEDGGKVQGQFQKWLQTTAGLSAQQATEVTKSAEAFGKAIDPVRRFFLELLTGTTAFIGKHATFVTALLAVAGGVTAIVFAARGLMAIRWAALWASMLVNPVLTAGLIALGGIVFLLTKRWLDARMEMAKFRDEAGLLSDEMRKFQMIDLAAQLALADAEMAAVKARLASRGPGTSETAHLEDRGDPAADMARQRALTAEIKLLRQKIEILRAVPASAGGTGEDDPKGKQTRDDRIKALGDEVSALTSLAALSALNRDDIARALELERTLTGELADGNNTRAQRVELEKQIAALRESGLALAPGTLVNIRAERAGVDEEFLLGVLPEQSIDEFMERTASAFERGAAELEQTIAGSLTDAITTGISQGFAAFSQGNIGDGFKAITGGFLSAVGGMFITIGKNMLLGLAFMEKIKASIIAFLPGAGIIAALGLIAFGGVLQGVGGSIAGGGSRGSGFAVTDGRGVPAGSAGFTRDERERGISRTIPNGIQGNAPTPQPHQTFNFTVIGENDPRAQRAIMNIVDNAGARGIGRRR